MLPDGWRIALLDSVSKRGSGHTPSKDHSDYWNGGTKWVSLADSWRLDRGYISETDKTISELGIQNSSAVMHPTGTVVMTRDAGVGKSGVLASPMAVSQHFIAWDCSESKDLHNWYLYHWLQYEKPEFERIAIGSTIKTIGLPYFKRLQIELPPKVEQRRIAEILDCWDEAIVTLERLLANSRRQKQDLTQGLLLNHRSFGEKKSTWSYIDFAQIFERITRKNVTGDTNVLTISGQHGLISQRNFFKKVVASNNLQGYTLLERGDFAYNKSYSSGYPVGAIKPLLTYESGVVSSLYICFRIRSESSSDFDFYRHYFEAGMLNEEINGIAQEGARNHGLLNVGIKEFFKLQLHVPPVEEQRRISEVLNVAEAEENCIARELEKIKEEKRVLLAELLTGKRRVQQTGTATVQEPT